MFNIHFSFERWKFNKEYGLYVSSLGRVKDRHKKLMQVSITNNGYCFVTNEYDKNVYVHRLVMMTFNPVKNYGILTVDHLNHNKRDNSLKNLEWVTAEENLRRAVRDYIPGTSIRANGIRIISAPTIDDWLNNYQAIFPRCIFDHEIAKKKIENRLACHGKYMGFIFCKSNDTIVGFRSE
jgi:hypothetical protein